MTEWTNEAAGYIETPLRHARQGEDHVTECGWDSPTTRCTRPLNHDGLHGRLAPGEEWNGQGIHLGSLWRRPSDNKSFRLVAITADGKQYDDEKNRPKKESYRLFYQATNSCPYIHDKKTPCTCEDDSHAPEEWTKRYG